MSAGESLRVAVYWTSLSIYSMFYAGRSCRNVIVLRIHNAFNESSPMYALAYFSSASTSLDTSLWFFWSRTQLIQLTAVALSVPILPSGLAGSGDVEVDHHTGLILELVDRVSPKVVQLFFRQAVLAQRAQAVEVQYHEIAHDTQVIIISCKMHGEL
jgi:hypothetical protein